MLTLRRFEESDAAACCAVINACIPTMDGLNAAARAFILAKNVPEILGPELAGYFTLVAIGPEGIEAVGALDGAELKRLYVHPQSQGRGAGTVLVRALAAEAGRRGVTRLALEASPSSVTFYSSLGFYAQGEETLAHGMAEFRYVKMTKEFV